MGACDEVQKVLKTSGSDFMHNDHLGTGLRAGCMIKLPQMSGRKDWKPIITKMGLQVRGTGGVDSSSKGGTWDVSNADRIGKGEVNLVNPLIEGAAQLVKWESQLDKGHKKQVEKEIAALLK